MTDPETMPDAAIRLVERRAVPLGLKEEQERFRGDEEEAREIPRREKECKGEDHELSKAELKFIAKEKGKAQGDARSEYSSYTEEEETPQKVKLVGKTKLQEAKAPEKKVRKASSPLPKKHDADDEESEEEEEMATDEFLPDDGDDAEKEGCNFRKDGSV